MRTVDTGVERVVNSLSPTNIYSRPIFRVIWSADRLHWAAGWWNDYDNVTGALVRRVFEARYVPKYQMAARWVVERWFPPEHYGDPELWAESTKQFSAQHNMSYLELGPFPSEGDYEWIWTCADVDGGYVELTPTLVESVINSALQPIATLAEMQAEAETKKAQEDVNFSKRLDDIIGDPFPFLGRTSNISPSSLLTKLREERKRGRTV